MFASTAVLDFTDDDELEDPQPLTGSREPTLGAQGGIMGRPITSKNKKQIRQRARRKMKVALDEVELLYDGRGIDTWDMEELARGRPRAVDGTFKGKAPAYINRSIHEQIVKRFEEIVREEMNGHTVEALKVIGELLKSVEVDEKNKPIVAAGTKLDAAKFLIEHVIGKPKQRMETDISVKLQAILGSSMVNPVNGGGFAPTQGYIEAASWEEDDDGPSE